MTNCAIRAEEIIVRTYNPALEFEEVKKLWIEMLNKCPHSYFLSWGWKETWIKTLPKDCIPSLIVGFKNNTPVFAFFIGSQKKTLYGVVKNHQISINETAIPRLDTLTIEYNAILLDPAFTLSLETLIQILPVKNWDELYFPKMRTSQLSNSGFQITPDSRYNIQKNVFGSRYIDLKKVREADMDYLSLLSQKRRKKIRRSIKLYEKIGALKLTVADTVDEALSMLDELKILHQKTWVDRGRPGSFASDFFGDFHRNLITRHLKKNEVQMHHLTCGQETVGYNYNFIYKGHVSSYLGGYNYQANGKFLPGMMCDYYSILYYAEKGLNEYDLLAGDVEYKRSLATDSSEMQDILVQKKKVSFAIIKKLKELYNSTRKIKGG